MTKDYVVKILTLLPNRLQPVHSSRVLGKRRDAEAMAQTFLGVVDVVVRDGGVRRHAVVPKSNRSLLPPQAHLEVLTLRDMLHKRISNAAIWGGLVPRREKDRGDDEGREGQNSR